MSRETEISRFGVAVIESLPNTQLHTGEMLCSGVLAPQCAADDTLFYSLYRVNSIDEYERAIHSIIDKHQPNEMLALHVEAHGCEEGIGLASGELLRWEKFLALCGELNTELGGLLIVTTAVCYSIPLMAAINPAQRAPFKAIIITRRLVTTNEIILGYTAYFEVYRNIIDIGPALDAMRTAVNDNGNIDSSPFAMFTSQWFFDQVTNPDRDPDSFQHIVNNWYCRLKSIDPSYTREQVESEIRANFKELALNGRDYFLYKDLYQ